MTGDEGELDRVETAAAVLGAARLPPELNRQLDVLLAELQRMRDALARLDAYLDHLALVGWVGITHLRQVLAGDGRHRAPSDPTD